MTHVSDLPKSVQNLVSSIEKHGVQSPKEAKNILSDSCIGVEDVNRWADYDHPLVDGYGRKLVVQGDHYELMVMSWMPGDYSAIHDHGSTQWGAVLFFGTADHAIYRYQDEKLETVLRSPNHAGDINEVSHSLIHQMGNPGKEPFLSVHLYGCLDKCSSITGDARIFDLLERKIQFTDGGVFYCLPESQINRRIDGPSGDLETTLTHHKQMLSIINRSEKIGQSNPGLKERKGRLLRELEALGETEPT